MSKENLVIVRAGDNSLHPQWLEGEDERTWDIVVNYYGNNPEIYRIPGVVRIDSKGPKWPALHDLLAANPNFLSNYKYIWLPDDDLLASKKDINELFDICHKNNLEVAQPSLTWDSYYSHLTTLCHKGTRIRFTNYVEIMGPCFRTDMLKKALPYFTYNLSGWGMDHIWPNLAEDPFNSIAIIDMVSVRHTRPVGGPNYIALKEKGVSPWDEVRAMCSAHGLSEEPIIATHKAILLNGKEIRAKEGQSPRFSLRFVAGYVPLVFYALDRRRALRRIAGMIWKGIWNIPDRVSEMTTPQKILLKYKKKFWSLLKS